MKKELIDWPEKFDLPANQNMKIPSKPSHKN